MCLRIRETSHPYIVDCHAGSLKSDKNDPYLSNFNDFEIIHVLGCRIRPIHFLLFIQKKKRRNNYIWQPMNIRAISSISITMIVINTKTNNIDNININNTTTITIIHNTVIIFDILNIKFIIINILLLLI